MTTLFWIFFGIGVSAVAFFVIWVAVYAVVLWTGIGLDEDGWYPDDL